MQAEKDLPIKFYKKDAQYGYFSNLYKAPFKVNERVYPTNEHYFQSKKFEGKPYELEVIAAKTPFDAFKMGQSKQYPIREDWQEVKQSFMYQGLKHKFTQNADLKQKLLQTGNRELIEHTDKDKYWADGGDGSGKNRLGILLMKLREQLRQ